MTQPWIRAFVDGHVHIHPGYDDRWVLDAAATNVARQAHAMGLSDCSDVLGVLMLAETASMDRFNDLRTQLRVGPPEAILDGWHLTESPGRSPGLLASRDGSPDILLVPGRQVRSHERLEVLFLNTLGTYSDDCPLNEILSRSLPPNSLTVLAWGVGKWLGRRGRIIDGIIRRGARVDGLMLGDNGGRPVCWSEPTQFRAARLSGLRILRGSDPLDLHGEVERIGSFGSLVEASIPRSDPVATITDYLRNPANPLPGFGNLQRNARFLRNQLGLRRRRTNTEQRV